MKLTDKQSGCVQMLRGLAIIAVVFIHNIPGGFAQVLYRPFFNFSVGLFLFFSGMLSDRRNWNPKKRILKVVLPYIFWTLIYVVINNYKMSSDIPVIFVKSLITGNAAGIMYYIFVYCEFTLLIPLIDKLAKSKYKYIGFVITPVEIVFMRLLPLLMGYEFNSYIKIIMENSCLGWFVFFYYGYLIGNGLIGVKCKKTTLIFLWAGTVLLQMLEGYWYWSLGDNNCGTQLKLTSILTGIVVTTIAYKTINSDRVHNVKILRLLGDNSFGIFFVHVAVILGLNRSSIYTTYVRYPMNAVVVVIISLLCVQMGRKILGKYGKFLAL